jgi:hypothetical protein
MSAMARTDGSAGHDPALIYDPTAGDSRRSMRRLSLGIMDDAEYEGSVAARCGRDR